MRTPLARPSEIAIIGCGLAGLVAARRLESRGFVAEIYEASHRAGGRILTETHGAWPGGPLDLGAEFIDSNHTRMLALVAELGLAIEDLSPAADDPPPVLHFCGRSYPVAAVKTELAPVRAAARSQAERAGRASADTPGEGAGRAPDQMSVRAWIERYVSGGMESSAGRLLDTAYSMEYGADTDDLSALNLVHALGAEKPASVSLGLFGDSDERYRVRGGTEQVVRSLAEGVKGKIQFAHRLVAAAGRPDGKVQLTFAVERRTREVVVDCVVMALPFSTLREADLTGLQLSDLKQTAIDELGMGTNAKLFVEFAAPYWRAVGCSGETYSDTGYQCTWEAAGRKEQGPAVLVNYTGGDAASALDGLSAEAAAQRFLAQIEPVLPGLSQWWTGRATLGTWSGAPFEKGSYSYYRVGQQTTFGGVEGLPEGSVLFAGEHTCPEFQGYMEGAVRSGERVAAEAAQRSAGSTGLMRSRGSE